MNEFEGCKTLKELLPREFFIEHTNSRAMKLLDRRAKVAPDGCWWPGAHKNCYLWWFIEGPEGYAVGWNENPARGWSFPVAILPSHKK